MIRGSNSITLLSCNSDAQANDNVNSDIKVSTYKMYDIISLQYQYNLYCKRIICIIQICTICTLSQNCSALEMISMIFLLSMVVKTLNF